MFVSLILGWPSGYLAKSVAVKSRWALRITLEQPIRNRSGLCACAVKVDCRQRQTSRHEQEVVCFYCSVFRSPSIEEINFFLWSVDLSQRFYQATRTHKSPANCSPILMRAISSSLILYKGGRTTARGNLPMRTRASFMRLCMSTNGSQ